MPPSLVGMGGERIERQGWGHAPLPPAVHSREGTPTRPSPTESQAPRGPKYLRDSMTQLLWLFVVLLLWFLLCAQIAK